jgi:hypothetical protein
VLQRFPLAFDSGRAANPSIFEVGANAQCHQDEAHTLIFDDPIAGTLLHKVASLAKNDVSCAGVGIAKLLALPGDFAESRLYTQIPALARQSHQY